MISGVAHVCLVVRDLDAAIGFYRDRLGLGEAFDFTNDAGERIGVYLRAGRRTFIELFLGEHGQRDDEQSYKHFCLEVDDIAATVDAMRIAGVEVTDPKLGCDRSWQAWLTDPDGNRIELHQYNPDSWQTPHL